MRSCRASQNDEATSADDASLLPDGRRRSSNTMPWSSQRIRLSMLVSALCAVVAVHMFIPQSPSATLSSERPKVVELADAHSDAAPFPNFQYVVLGYNIYYGDPLPITYDSTQENAGDENVGKVMGGEIPGTMDPGLRKPLFQVKYTQKRLTGDRRHTQADGYHSTVDQGCSTVMSTKSIKSSHEFKTDQKNEISLTATATFEAMFPPPQTIAGEGKFLEDVSVGIESKAMAGATGTMSQQWQEIQTSSSKRDEYQYRSSAKCSSYVAAYSYVRPPLAHPEFQKAVDNADSNEDWYAIFDDFGTHMLTGVKMGARHGSSTFINKRDLSEVVTKVDGFSVSMEAAIGATVEVGVSYKDFESSAGNYKYAPAVSAKWKASLVSPQAESASKTVKNYVRRVTTAMVGVPLPKEGAGAWLKMVKKNPVPISFDTDLICMHPSVAGKEDKIARCEDSLKTYCEKHLKDKGADCAAPGEERECFADLDCKEDFVCRNYDCVEVPKCEATLYSGVHFGGSAYTLPYVTDVKNGGGKMFNLANGGYSGSISSLKLSEGCSMAELIDDDGDCKLGKGDNKRTTVSLGALQDDLEDDVCKIKLWAKPTPVERPSLKFDGWVDLHGARVTQSSTHDGFGAGRAVDGNTEGQWSFGSCTHTNYDVSPYWEVDLGKEYLITGIKLWNRKDCCGDRLSSITLLVDGVECASGLSVGQGAAREFVCERQGRTVRVHKLEPGFLTLCEVEVRAKLVGKLVSGATAVSGVTADLPMFKLSHESKWCKDGTKTGDIAKIMKNLDECKKACWNVKSCKWLCFDSGNNWCTAYSSCGVPTQARTGSRVYQRIDSDATEVQKFDALPGHWCRKGIITTGKRGPVKDLDECKQACLGNRECKWVCFGSKNNWCTTYSSCGEPVSESAGMTVYELVSPSRRLTGTPVQTNATSQAISPSHPLRGLSAPAAEDFTYHLAYSGQWCNKKDGAIEIGSPRMPGTVEACMEYCNSRPGCRWFMYDGTNSYCVPLSECGLPSKHKAEMVVYERMQLGKPWYEWAHKGKSCATVSGAGVAQSIKLPVSAGGVEGPMRLESCMKACSGVAKCTHFMWDSSSSRCVTYERCDRGSHAQSTDNIFKKAAAPQLRDFSTYLPNIGKAMYGYNHYYGAPASVETAGTDPGFQHRPLWHVSYDKKLVAQLQTFTSVPGFGLGTTRHSYEEWPATQLPDYTSFGTTSLGISEAKSKCTGMDECIGITCTDVGCTLRKGKKLTASADVRMTLVKKDKQVDKGPCSVTLWQWRGCDGLSATFEVGKWPQEKFYSSNFDKTRMSCATLEGGPGCSATVFSGFHLVGPNVTITPGEWGYHKLRKYGWPAWWPIQSLEVKLAPPSRRLQQQTVAQVLEPARRLQQKTVPQVPDGWKATYATETFCSSDFNTREIRSQYDYQAEMTDSLNPNGLAVGYGALSFTMSKESKEFSQSNSKNKKSLYLTSGECVDYVVEMSDNFPQTSDNFQYAVDQTHSEKAFYMLFDMYGLSFPRKVVFGARYGRTQQIDEASWKTVSKKTESWSVSADVSRSFEHSVGGVDVSATVGVSAKYGEEDSESQIESFDSYFSEVKEFSLGKRIPDNGGVEAWAKDAGHEPMPIRYELSSICSHPAFRDTQSDDCKKYLKTYCINHLTKVGQDVDCEPPSENQCLWDIDCLPHHACIEGSCVKEPSCIVQVWQGLDRLGNRREFGPVFWSDSPMGQVLNVGGDICSVTIGAGCAEVVLMDEDKCWENYEDNVIIENRLSNKPKTIMRLPTDLRNDVCKMKIVAKKMSA